MKTALCLLACGLVFCYLPEIAALARSTVTVTFNVLPFENLAFSGSPSHFLLLPNYPQVDTSTTYSVATNHSCHRILAALDSNMPIGVSLAVNLTAPNMAISNGMRTLSATPIELVRGIGQTNTTDLSVVYHLSVDFDAIPGCQEQRIITYTLCN